MLIRIPKGWEIPEREAAPEDIYRNRRQFLKTLSVAGLAGAASACGLGGIYDEAEASASPVEYPPLPAPRNEKYMVERPIPQKEYVSLYNNFYEFTTDKPRVKDLAVKYTFRPWEIEVGGEVEKPLRIDVDDLMKKFTLEERVYRHRCVEAWSVIVPWVGFPLAEFVKWAKPKSTAKYLRMVSILDPENLPGQKSQDWYPWPYYEGLTLAEATNDLALLVVGSYGHILPNQNGAPIRLHLPWKYGYKSIKSIVKFEFTRTRPKTFWNDLEPKEYGFVSNVNPSVPHPRWSQATEQDIATGKRIPTRMYNGYGEFVAPLYES